MQTVFGAARAFDRYGGTRKSGKRLKGSARVPLVQWPPGA